MSLESKIIDVQNSINSKQSKIGTLTVDRLVVNSPINVSSLSLGNLSISNLNVSGTLTTNGLNVTGGANFGGSVNMTGNTNITNLSSSNISIRELRDLVVKGSLTVETTINAGSEIRGSVVRNAVWN